MFNAKYARMYAKMLYYEPVWSGLDDLLRSIDMNKYKRIVNGLYLVLYLYTRTGLDNALIENFGFKKANRIISKIDDCFLKDIRTTLRLMVALNSDTQNSYNMEEDGLFIPMDAMPISVGSFSNGVVWLTYCNAAKDNIGETKKDQCATIADIEFWRSMFSPRLSAIPNEEAVLEALIGEIKNHNRLLDNFSLQHSDMPIEELCNLCGYNLLRFITFDPYELSDEQNQVLSDAIKEMCIFSKDKLKRYGLH